MTYNILYFHGWSYDADFFKDFAKHLSYSAQFFDRGYFRKPHTPILKDGHNIAVTHSMGLFFLCEYYDLNNFDKIIILSGFSDFCAGRDDVIVKTLHEGLVKHPEKTLRRFSLLCDDRKRKFDPHHLNYALLQSDLDLLIKHSVQDIILPHQDKIYTVHGDNDKVIPVEFCQISAHKNMIVTNAGHVYNKENNNKIIEEIKAWIME